MMCRMCGLNRPLPNQAYCDTCWHVARARYLENRLAVVVADNQQVKHRLDAATPKRTLRGLEAADAMIIRCPMCDARMFANLPHVCRRAAA